MSRHFRKTSDPSVHQHGAALIVTLLLLTLLVVVVTGFLSTTRVEQMAARNYTYQSAAEQMAQLATKQAINALRTNYQTATSSIIFATQPGAMAVFGGASGTQLLPLYSSNSANTTNLNSLATNGWITGNAAQAVNVGLINVSDNAGRPIGRYGFFIDDESAKLPLNAAVGARNTLNPIFPRPYGVDGVAGFTDATKVSGFSSVVGGGSVGANSMSNWSYFFTPEQAVRLFGLGAANLPLVSAAYETNAAYSTNTPWGSPKVYLNSIPFSDVGVSQIVSALTNSNLTRLFGQNFADKYGSANVRQLAANILQMRDINVFNTAPTNFWRTNALLGGVGLPPGAPVESVPTAGATKKTNGIPQDYLGHAPFPMLEEVAVYYVYGWTTANVMTVRFIVDCRIFNPFPVEFDCPSAGISLQVDKAIFPVFYRNDPGIPIGSRYRGPFGSAPKTGEKPYNDLPLAENDPWGDGGGIYKSLTPANGAKTEAIGKISAQSSVTKTFTFDVSFDESNPTAEADSFFSSFVILDQIKLLADTNNPQSIRDWCSGHDFFNTLASSASGPSQFAIAKPPGAAGNPEGTVAAGGAALDPLLAPPPSTKTVKLDPRMRPPLAVSSAFSSAAPGRAWTNIAYGSSAPNGSAFTNASIPADLSFTANAVAALHDTNMPPYLNVSGLAVPTYHSVADLGKVFTGMPWRRLRLQPQPPQETNSSATGGMIPDWVILDIFDVSTPTTAVTPVNPNSTIASQGAPIARASAGLLSQMGSLTSMANIPQLGNPTVAGGAPITQLTYASLVATNNSRLQTISSNAASPGTVASWSAGWRARRAALGFPVDVLLLPSEITEVAGISDFIAPTNLASKANEQRLATLFPGMQTKSRFFTIYALGEAFEGTNANSPVASQRILKTMVRVNTNSSPPGVDIIYQVAPQN